MMTGLKRYAFFGNRAFVLEAMIEAGLDVVSIGVVDGSYAQKYAQQKGIECTALSNKPEFIKWIAALDCDRFISNGCPYIIPKNILGRGIRFINIHPSYLPDLRGVDPVPGAILYGRDSGATCHVMDTGIDTGDIIAQVKIPYSPKWDAPLLYQLSFKAEVNVFKKALALGFEAQYAQELTGNEITYARKPEDLIINFSENAEETCRRVRAFSNKNQLARFMHNGSEVKVSAVERVEDSTVNEVYADAAIGEVVSVAENTMILKKNEGFLRLYCNSTESIKAGDRL